MSESAIEVNSISSLKMDYEKVIVGESLSYCRINNSIRSYYFIDCNDHRKYGKLLSFYSHF